jgi:MEMO1 family protein
MTMKYSLWLPLTVRVLLAFVILAGASSCPRAHSGDVRPPAVAGKFYPESPVMLRKAVEGFFAEAVPGGRENPVAIVAPHAGYIFSGQIAADAFAQVRQRSVDLVVILGTNHTAPGLSRIAVHPGRGFRTPLGVATIDREMAAALTAASSDCIAEAGPHEKEHSVEVQVPFVQVRFPEAKILPLVVGNPDEVLCSRFGKILADVVRHRRVLIVASTDLSHYPAHEDATRVDLATLGSLAALDDASFRAAVHSGSRNSVPGLVTAACGKGPVLVALSAARHLGAQEATIISYANSGDTSVGDRERVVGYGAAAMKAKQATLRQSDTFSQARGGVVPAIAAGTPVPSGSCSLGNEDRKSLLRFARSTLSRFLETATTPLARGFGESARQQRGVFVTLKKHGELRGCIGQMTPDAPLCTLVGKTILKSAFEDRRFPPVTRDELEDISIEISVLTPFQPVSSAAAIIVGRDGVLLRKGERGAVFLPQVAPEQGWGREEMLDHLCRKAGLAAGAWREGAQLFTFQAVVFGENDAL